MAEPDKAAHSAPWRAMLLALSAAVPLLVVAGAVIVRARTVGDETGDGPPAQAATYDGTVLDEPAPGFSLTDQEGSPVALADLRGRVVVLAFLDSRCDETCPLTAQELRFSAEALGPGLDERVAFFAINVNRNFNRPEDVARFTREQRLNEIPGWHFLTGPAELLEPVWAAYRINVQPPSEPGEDDFEHTPGIFLIDQKGNLARYLSVPLLEGDAIPSWEGPLLRDVVEDKVRELLE